jgi:hypothetical protein
MSDDDPDAYKPAPGDKGKKTKPSQYTKKFDKMYGEKLGKDADMGDYIKDFEKSDSPQFKGKSKEKRKDMAIAAYLSRNEEMETLDEKITGLVNKSKQTGVPYGILKKSYDRGMAAWKTGHRPGTTPQQWAMARVNSMLTGGKADPDLQPKARAAKKKKKASAKKENFSSVQEWFESSITRAKYQMHHGEDWWWKMNEVHDKLLEKLDEDCCEDCINEENPCWDGFKQVGMKTLNGKKVPNCVPEEFNEQTEHEITVGNYTTKFFYMCGSAQTTMKKHADKEGAEELTRMQDVFYKMEKNAMDAGGASDEQKKKSQILYDKIIAKANDMGIKNDVDKYMKMHLNSMLNNKPKLGFGRTDLEEKGPGLWANIHKKRKEGRPMRKKGEKGAPTQDQIKRAQGEGYQKFNQFVLRNHWGEITEKAEYQGRPVELNNPTRGDKKKYKVYVKNDKGNVVKVEYGDPNMSIKRDDPARRKSFRARHNCDNPGPKYKARYWSCKFWSTKSVTDLMKG